VWYMFRLPMDPMVDGDFDGFEDSIDNPFPASEFLRGLIGLMSIDDCYRGMNVEQRLIAMTNHGSRYQKLQRAKA
jgi:hypothetical protein